MARQNQGFRKDLNLAETISEVDALDNLGGSGIARDIQIIQNNLRNTSSVSYEQLSNGFFFFGNDSDFVFTNDDVVTVSEDISVGNTSLYKDVNYYVCDSDGETKFKLSRFPSSIGISTINVTNISLTNFSFIRKDPVSQDNLINFIKPEIQDTQNFNYLGSNNINGVVASIKNSQEISKYYIDKKYKGNEDTLTTNIINIEGNVVIEDPANFNSTSTAIDDQKSPGIFIGNTRAFSSDNNPWQKVGTSLTTNSSLVSIGELYFSSTPTITGISTLNTTPPENIQNIWTNSTGYKLPIVINDETYYILLNT